MKTMRSEIVDCINNFMDKIYTKEDEKIATFVLRSLSFYDDLKSMNIINDKSGEQEV